MRLLHLSDLHLGRRLYDLSLLEDQTYILDQILSLVDQNRPDAVLLCGDLYDKAVPPAEAVQVLDRFLTELAKRETAVLLISGNHDSAERLQFGADIFSNKKIYISSVFSGAAEPVVLEDKHGKVYFYLLPFFKPVHARHVYPDAAIENDTDAVRHVMNCWEINPQQRNVLLAHQTVAGALRTDSEILTIGGLDQIEASLLDCFDYTALGHIHRAQSAGKETVRYCGSPLAYSFSETETKTVTWVELEEKGNVTIRTQELQPLRPLRNLKGVFEELLSLPPSQDYLRVILTDEEDVPHALARLQDRFPNLLRLEYDNLRTRMEWTADAPEEEALSPMALLKQFYVNRNGQEMSDRQQSLAKELMEQIWEGEL